VDLVAGGLEHVADDGHQVLALEELELDQHSFAASPAGTPAEIFQHLFDILRRQRSHRNICYLVINNDFYVSGIIFASETGDCNFKSRHGVCMYL
jgi:hypothetical protein